jgi:hypothetical protein
VPGPRPPRKTANSKTTTMPPVPSDPENVAKRLARARRLVKKPAVALLGTGILGLLASLIVVMAAAWHLEGPPPKGATAKGVDMHCARLLKSSQKIDGRAWLASKRPLYREGLDLRLNVLQSQITWAYENGASRVFVANPQTVDDDGLPSPDLVVVLPEDEKDRRRVLTWYWDKPADNRGVPKAGEKYLYLLY